MGKDYYSTLQIPRSATQTDIRKAYRMLAIKYHPDKNTAENAAEIFKEINEAYEILSNEEERKIYDNHGEDGIKQGGFGTNPAGEFHFRRPEDIFREFFGGEDPFASIFNSFFNDSFFGGRRRPLSSFGTSFDSPFFSHFDSFGDNRFFSESIPSSRYDQPRVTEPPLYRDIQYNFGRNGSSGIKIRIYSRNEEPAAGQPQPAPQPTNMYYQQPPEEVIDLSFRPNPVQTGSQGQGTCCVQCCSCHRFNSRGRSYFYRAT